MAAGGVAPAIRPAVWPFLLGVLSPRAPSARRREEREALRRRYERLCRRFEARLAPRAESSGEESDGEEESEEAAAAGNGGGGVPPPPLEEGQGGGGKLQGKSQGKKKTHSF